MYSVRKIQFINHPILKGLELDFCDLNGKVANTIIFAGENGTGKSTIINELYKLSSHTLDYDCNVEIEIDGKINILEYRLMQHHNGRKYMHIVDHDGFNDFIFNDRFKEKYNFYGIFSDVDINFHSANIDSVTSMKFDELRASRKSEGDLPTKINQLIIDVQALDDAYVAKMLRDNPDKSYNSIKPDERMSRFTRAFNKIFRDNLKYSHIDTHEGRKVILFNKNGCEIPIENLSSGEKQIVYRGGFLLKDVNAIRGSFVFIDEPEISLHPLWQMNILDYYKGIFTNEEGKQTSQIFIVTHSPFIIHNKNRIDDKIIVLDRDSNGNTIIKDRQEYYKCDSIEMIEDAFHICGFVPDKSIVYLEGRTDEYYFNKAVEVYGYKNLPFKFQWVGYLDKGNKEVNTGKDALNKAYQFLIANQLSVKNVCLFDCDTNRSASDKNNVYSYAIKQYKNSKGIKRGIENALVLENVDISKFYNEKEKIDDYGAKNIIRELDKMELCKHICAKTNDELKFVFAHIKEEIENVNKIFSAM